MDKTDMALQRCGYGILQGANSRLSRRFVREGREVSAQEIVGLGDRDVDRVPVTSRRDGGGCEVIRREPGAESGQSLVRWCDERFDLGSARSGVCEFSQA